MPFQCIKIRSYTSPSVTLINRTLYRPVPVLARCRYHINSCNVIGITINYIRSDFNLLTSLGLRSHNLNPYLALSFILRNKYLPLLHGSWAPLEWYHWSTCWTTSFRAVLECGNGLRCTDPQSSFSSCIRSNLN